MSDDRLINGIRLCRVAIEQLQAINAQQTIQALGRIALAQDATETANALITQAGKDLHDEIQRQIKSAQAQKVTAGET